MDNDKKIVVSKYSGTSKLGVEFTAIKLQIGRWETLIFPKTKFEKDYIFDIIENYEK